VVPRWDWRCPSCCRCKERASLKRQRNAPSALAPRTAGVHRARPRTIASQPRAAGIDGFAAALKTASKDVLSKVILGSSAPARAAA